MPLADKSCTLTIIQRVVEYLKKHAEFEAQGAEDEVHSPGRTITHSWGDCGGRLALPSPCISVVDMPLFDHILTMLCGAFLQAINAFDKEFQEQSDEIIFQTILAANFLDIKNLLELMCKKVLNHAFPQTSHCHRRLPTHPS